MNSPSEKTRQLNHPSPGSIIVLGLALIAAIWALTRSWDAHILDRHEFRQLQTATTTYWIQEEGFRMAYPTPLFGPPWSAPMEFPLYQSGVALVGKTLGVPLEQAGRAVSIAWFLLMLPAVYGLLRMGGLGPSGATISLAVVATAPVYLFYSRTVMIESTALCLSTWYLWAHVRALRSGSRGYIAAAVLLGILAVMVKVTTFALFLLPAAAFAIAALRRVHQHPDAGKTAYLRTFAAAIAPPAAAGFAGWGWVAFADGVKRSNPFSEFLTSERLSVWNFGEWSQRLDPEFWKEIHAHVTFAVIPEASLALLAFLLFFVPSRHRRAALLLTAAFLVGPLVFSNLYRVHDYYLYANAVFLLGAAGCLIAGALRAPGLSPATRAAVIVIFFGFQGLAFVRGYGDYHRRELPSPPELAEVIRETVSPGEVVLIHGWDWNCLLPYYSRRKAIMVPIGYESDVAVLEEIVSRLGAETPIGAMVVGGPHPLDDGMRRWCEVNLGLVSTPVAEAAEGTLYLAAGNVAAAESLSARRSFPGVRMNFSPPADDWPEGMQVQRFSPGDLGELVVPTPEMAMSVHGISLVEHDGEKQIDAHTPSELRIRPPPDARMITAVFGIPEAAYTGPQKTDGVDVEIFETLPSGLRRLLYRRELRPAENPADRGLQRTELSDIAPLTGSVSFRFTPGPHGNASFDWCYWREIRIE